jgi:hypothetical protein
MGSKLQLLLPALLLALSLFSLGGCGCGFDCNSNDNDNPTDPALLTLGLSDSLPEDLKEVWIEVDAITFKRSGAQDVVIEEFTISGGVKVGTFKVPLLDYPGTEQLEVIKGLELATGTYEVSIKVIANGINSSFVKDANDVSKPITVSGDTLAISGMKLAAGNQVFTVEFSLAQALSQTTTGTYRLATTGMRLENNLTDATLSGTINSELFDTAQPCEEKATPTSGNRVYLYKGIDAAKNLTDVFTSASTTAPPESTLAPFAVASLIESTSGGWSYAFGYVPAGDYTMAFSCNTGADDSIQWNNLTIPLPTTQRYEIKLSEKEKAVCNLPTTATCG